MPTLTLSLVGLPAAQPRPRFRVGPGRAVRSYTPSSHPVTAWKRRIIAAAGLEVSKSPGVWPRGGAVRLSVVFCYPQSGRRRLHRRRRLERPDADNLLKAVMDALNSVLWLDDAQVWSLRVRKYHGCFGEPGGLWLRVFG